MEQPKKSIKAYGTYKLTGFRKRFYNLCQKLDKNNLSFRFGLVLRKLVLQNRLQIVDADPLGIKGRFYPLDNLGDRYVLFLPNFFERPEFDLLRKTLKPNDTFVDIGANTGFYSLIAAKNIGDGRVVAFEPNPNMYDRFTTNIGFNNLDKKITALPIGIADKDSEFDLSLNPTNLGGASIVNKERGDTVTVKCRPLLNVLNEQDVSSIDALKIDIEGAEHLALNPFFENAPKSLYPKLIIIETYDKIPLEDLGYELVNTTKSGNGIFKLLN